MIPRAQPGETDNISTKNVHVSRLQRLMCYAGLLSILQSCALQSPPGYLLAEEVRSLAKPVPGNVPARSSPVCSSSEIVKSLTYTLPLYQQGILWGDISYVDQGATHYSLECTAQTQVILPDSGSLPSPAPHNLRAAEKRIRSLDSGHLTMDTVRTNAFRASWQTTRHGIYSVAIHEEPDGMISKEDILRIRHFRHSPTGVDTLVAHYPTFMHGKLPTRVWSQAWDKMSEDMFFLAQELLECNYGLSPVEKRHHRFR